MIKIQESIESAYITTVEDILEGSIGNMSDKELDNDLKKFRKYARTLKVRDYKNLVVLIDEDMTYSSAYIEISSVPYEHDAVNGIDFYFFKSEEDCYKFIEQFESHEETITESHHFELNVGDYVDFGVYGKLYVVRDLGDGKYWVTDEESERNNPRAPGWSIDGGLAKYVIDNDDDEEDELDFYY